MLSRMITVIALQKSVRTAIGGGPAGAPLFMGFSLLRASEFFVFRKMEMPETINHLLCGWRQIVIQKNHLSVMIELFKLLYNERKGDFNGTQKL